MKRSNFKKKATQLLLNNNRISVPCLELSFGYRDDWVIANENEIIYDNSSLNDGMVVLYKNKEPILKVHVIAEKSEPMLDFSKEPQTIAILQINIINIKTYISDEELKNIIIVATANKNWLFHPKIEEYENKMFWVGDPICITERGCALHVDNCPKGARYYGVQPYANYWDDCSYCEFRYTRQGKFDVCVGKLKILSKDDLNSIVDIERENDYITASSHIDKDGETTRITYTIPKNCGKTLQQLWKENEESPFVAKNLSNFLVQIDESPSEMLKQKGDCYGILLSTRRRCKIFGWDENTWELCDDIKCTKEDNNEPINESLQAEREQYILEKERLFVEKQRLIEEDNLRRQAKINELLENPCFPLSKEDIRELANVYSDLELRIKIRNIIKADMAAGGKCFDELANETKHVENSLHTILCSIYLNIKIN